MTVKQVRDNFIQNLAENAYINMCTTDEMQIVISALEKQIPQKPMTYNKYERICECGAIVKTYQKHCKDCGQALDWSDD